MNTQVVSERIARAAAAGDFSSVQRLAALGQRLEEIGARETALAKEKEELRQQLEGGNGATHHRSVFFSAITQIGERQTYSRGNLVVEIDLPRAGRLRIAERTAAETMGVLMEHLLTELGIGALERLQQFRTGRGPLISKQPDRDFRNSKTGEIYANRRIPGTDLYLITHSSTLEKVARLKEALRFLGLPDGSYRIVKTD